MEPPGGGKRRAKDRSGGGDRRHLPSSRPKETHFVGPVGLYIWKKEEPRKRLRPRKAGRNRGALNAGKV